MSKRLFVVLAGVTVMTASASSGGEAVSGCAVAVTGGTRAEDAAAQAAVCRMPGTLIRSIQINAQPPDAPSDTVWLAITVPHPPNAQTLRSFLVYARGKWEAEIAAPAIRDRFVRLGLRHVVAYGGAQSEPRALVGIALPRWGIRRWTTGAPSRNLGKRADAWPVLQAKLVALARKYRVKTSLVRYEPLGKAPLVWISTPRAARFIAAGGFAAYERALHFREARYDGIFIALIVPRRAALLVSATYRGRQGEGCGEFRRIRGAERICPSQ